MIRRILPRSCLLTGCVWALLIVGTRPAAAQTQTAVTSLRPDWTVADSTALMAAAETPRDPLLDWTPADSGSEPPGTDRLTLSVRHWLAPDATSDAATGVDYLTPGIIVAAGLFTFKDQGLLNRADIREYTQEHVSNLDNKFDNFGRFAPALAVYGLNLAGVTGKHTTGRATLNYAVGSAIYASGMFFLKAVTNVERPDGSDKSSFPSGHTAAAFASAVFLEKEYGYRGRLIPIAGYTVASITGLSRILKNRHWSPDVLVGAGIGLVGMNLGYALMNRISPRNGKKELPEHWGGKPGERRPHFVDIKGGYARVNRDMVDAEGAIFARNGYQFGAEGAYFINRNIGFGGEWSLSSFESARENFSLPPNLIPVTEELVITPVGSQSVYVGPYVDLPLGRVASITGKFTAGWSAGATTKILLRIKQEAQGVLPAEVPLATYDGDSSFGWATRLGIRFHVLSHYSLLAFGEYNASTHDYTVTSNSVDPGGTITPLPDRTITNIRLDYYSLGAAVSIMAW